jgi:hypothetical protein
VYYSQQTKINTLTDELNSYLLNCPKDSEGYCNIPITLSAGSNGRINLSNINIYYTEGLIPLDVSSLDQIYQNSTLTLFEFKIQNNGASTINNINWSLNTGDNGYTINSTTGINLTSEENVYVLAEYNYSAYGIFAVTANATDGISSDTDTITIGLDQHKFYIQNSSGSNIAWFGDAGNIVLKGTLAQNSNRQLLSTDLFAFQDSSGNNLMIMDDLGNMYIKGSKLENQATLSYPPNCDCFIIQSQAGETVSYINSSGYLLMKGTLTENGNP